MKAKGIMLCLLLSAVTAMLPAQEDELNAGQLAWLKIEKAELLYFNGEYESCRDMVDSLIKAIEDKSESFPAKAEARLYVIRAYLAYAFREEQYGEKIKALLQQAVELDLDLMVDDPGMIPPYIFNEFNKVKAEYLAQYSRTKRRNTIGVFGALIFDLNVFSNIPDFIQPGVHYSYNISDELSIAFDMRLPLQLLLHSDLSFRGQVGLLWYPAFEIEKLYFGPSVYYLFSLDNLLSAPVYTHSLSLCNQCEIIFRNGIGFGINVEIMRLDLIVFTNQAQGLPDYRSIYLIPDALRLVFANLNFFIFYAF